MDYRELRIKYAPLINKFLRKYSHLYREDLEQEASIALYKAYRDWNPEHKSKASFLTFAYRYVRNQCYLYMRDKACIIRTPRSIFEEGEHIDCLSLDQEMKTGIPLDALCGQEDPFEQDYDKFLAIWNKLDKLVLKGIISARDLKFLHLRYEEQYDYKSIGSMYNCSAQRVAQVVDRTIQRIRPYFLDRKPI